MVLGSGDRQLGSGGQWPGTRRATRARQAQVTLELPSLVKAEKIMLSWCSMHQIGTISPRSTRQENNLYLGSRRGARARPSIDVLSPLRLF